MDKEPGGEFEPPHHLAVVSPDSSLTKTAFLDPPPSLCFALSSPLCFLPLEPIHWLEQRLTVRSLITMTQNPACFDLQHKHAPPAGLFHSCRFYQLPFFSLHSRLVSCGDLKLCVCVWSFAYVNAGTLCLNLNETYLLVQYCNRISFWVYHIFFKWLLGMDGVWQIFSHYE